MNSYTLNRNEQELAHTIGMARLANSLKRNPNYTKGLVGNDPPEFYGINGMAGELAFCRMYNYYPDLDTDCERPPDHDVVLRNCMLCDVKTTARPDGKLMVWPEKHNRKMKCDIYVLFTGNYLKSWTYTAQGWCWGRDLFQDHNLLDNGTGYAYTLPQSALNPMSGVLLEKR